MSAEPERPILLLRWAGAAASGLSLAFAVSLLQAPTVAWADDDPTPGGQAGLRPETTDASAPAIASKPSIQSALGAAGDPGGLRAFLQAKGITFDFTYIGELLGNPTGGIKQGATYEGRLGGRLAVDLGKLAGLRGTSIHASFYETNGRGLSGNNLHDLFVVSGIEAFPTASLYRVYVEQAFGDRLTVRAGQLAADFEFDESRTANVFVDSTFGWPASFANDLPSGGPAFPLATPGVRVKYAAPNVAVLAAIYNGDPAGPYRPGINNASPQIRDVSGTSFRLKDPPLVFTEAQLSYAVPTSGSALPGTAKLGYFHHFGVFADNLGTGTLRGDDGVYGVLDQMIYRPAGGSGSMDANERGAFVFARASFSPGDRNLIDLYGDCGIAFKGLLAGRLDDTLGLAAAYGRVSPAVRPADIASGTPLVRDFQAGVELTYQYRVASGFTVQPDAQYIFHPGAHGVGDPSTGQPVRDAAVLGVRATLHY